MCGICTCKQAEGPVGGPQPPQLALEARRARVRAGPRHPDVVNPLGSMAMCLAATGQFARAAECGHDAVAIAAEAFGEDNFLTKNARAKLDRVEGGRLRGEGRAAEAALLLARALAFWEGDARWGPSSKDERVVGTREELRLCGV